MAHNAPEDGICYRARHDPERINLAHFDRSGTKGITEHPRGSLVDPANAAELTAILRRYVMALL